MPMTGEAHNAMLTALVKDEAPALKPTHVSVYQLGTNAAVLVEPVTQVDSETLKATGHGFSAGDRVVLPSLSGGTGGVSPLVAERVYCVIAAGLTTDNFRVSQVEGGTAEVWETAVTAGKVAKLTEAAVARIAIGTDLSAATVGKSAVKSSTEHQIKVTASKSVDYISLHTAITAGKPVSFAKVTHEPFSASEWTYAVTSNQLDLLGSA